MRETMALRDFGRAEQGEIVSAFEGCVPISLKADAKLVGSYHGIGITSLVL
jgi:hypothetical protein